MVRFPTASHLTPLWTPDSSGGNCAGQVMASFLDDPSAPPDESCVEDLVPVDFEGVSSGVVEASQVLFGRPELWGDA